MAKPPMEKYSRMSEQAVDTKLATMPGPKPPKVAQRPIHGIYRITNGLSPIEISLRRLAMGTSMWSRGRDTPSQNREVGKFGAGETIGGGNLEEEGTPPLPRLSEAIFIR